MNESTVAAAKVIAVLLADGWHRVVQGSFAVGALSFGAADAPDVLGFWFEEADEGSPYRPAALSGPLNSILAVRQVGAARQARELGHPLPRPWPRPAPEAVA